MDDQDEAPLSLATRYELEQLEAAVSSPSRYPVLALARVLFKVLAVLVLIGGVLGLFVVTVDQGTDRTLAYDLTAFQVFADVAETASRALILWVFGSLIGLALDMADGIRALRQLPPGS